MAPKTTRTIHPIDNQKTQPKEARLDLSAGTAPRTPSTGEFTAPPEEAPSAGYEGTTTTDPRIDERIGHVDSEIHDHESCGDEERDTLDGHQVPAHD